MTFLALLSGANHPDALTRRAVSELLDAEIQALDPDAGTVLGTILDLAQFPVPLVDGSDANWPGANPVYVEQLEAADHLVIAAPVYNFGIPAALKAWIDQVVIANRTFDPETYTGLLQGKRATIVTAAGGSDPEQTPAHVPYLRQILGFIGITDVTVQKV